MSRYILMLDVNEEKYQELSDRSKEYFPRIECPIDRINTYLNHLMTTIWNKKQEN